MNVSAPSKGGAEADVTLLLEGTYPYVAGGVSSWVHDLLKAFPDRRFSILHIGPHPGAYAGMRYELPANVLRLAEVYCRGHGEVPRTRLGLFKKRRRSRRGAPPRMLRAIERLHLDDSVDEVLLSDLGSADLSLDELLYGEDSFELAERIYRRLCPDAPFLDFFWHFRAMHAPLVRMIAAPCPEAAAYHAASAGYAGLVGALVSFRRRRPFVLTEHGLYAREREMELARAAWLLGQSGSTEASRSALRKLWSRHFKMMSRIAYFQARTILALSETNRRKQISDGADPEKTVVVPNGVDLEAWRSSDDRSAERSRPLRVGFVGRVVPIKDILTLLRATAIARNRIDLELSIIGPTDEDAAYAERCQALVSSLGLGGCVRFLGPQPAHALYPDLDVVVLTSLSEGQPLVILEAHAAGLPAVATDVGACRELLEGKEEDEDLGPSGIVTRVANPEQIADALVQLARDPELRLAMGKAGRARVERSYQLSSVIARYGEIYGAMIDA